MIFMWKDYKIAGMSSTINPFEPPKAALETSADIEAAPALWNPDAAGLSWRSCSPSSARW
jgi:hypothetical protein